MPKTPINQRQIKPGKKKFDRGATLCYFTVDIPAGVVYIKASKNYDEASDIK